MKRRPVCVLVALFVGLAGCGGDSTAPPPPLDVRAGFIPVAGGLLDVGVSDRADGGPPGPPGPAFQISSDDTLRIQGANGELAITGIWGVASELRFGETPDACDGGGSGCHPFDSPPLVVVFPIAGELVPLASGTLPAGTYEGVSFEIEDFEVDGPEDEEKSDELADGLERIRMNPEFSDWPAEAAVLFTGAFTPDGGSAQEFRSYFTAERIVDVPVASALSLTAEDDGKDIQVFFAPTAWLIDRETGDVADLSQYDFGATGQVWGIVTDLGADPAAAFVNAVVEGEGSALGPS